MEILEKLSEPNFIQKSKGKEDYFSDKEQKIE
jgi:hypothetical protein